MAKFSKVERVFLGITAICLVILIYLGICCGVFFRKKELGIAVVTTTQCYIAMEMLRQDYDYDAGVKSKQFYRDAIEKDLGVKFYIYGETDLGSKYNGLTIPTIRTILIHDDVTGEDYCIVFAHESIHLTQFISNERYVCFETFKYLYESKIEELHNAGVRFGLKQIQGVYSGEYDVYDLIVDYLTK